MMTVSLRDDLYDASGDIFTDKFLSAEEAQLLAALEGNEDNDSFENLFSRLALMKGTDLLVRLMLDYELICLENVRIYGAFVTLFQNVHPS